MTKAIKRATCALLSILLVFMIFAVPAAQPAQAVAVSAVVISAVLAAMAVWGVSTITAGMTAAQIQDWVSTKLNEWASSQSSTVASLIPISGISVTATALLVLGNAAANGVKSFINWLSNDVSLVPGQTTVVQYTASTYAGVEMSYGANGLSFWYYVRPDQAFGIKVRGVFDGPVYAYVYDDGSQFEVNFFSSQQFVITTNNYDIDGEFINTETNTANYMQKYGYFYRISRIQKNFYNYTNVAPSFVTYNTDIFGNVNVNTGSTVVGDELKLKTDVSYNLPVDLTQPESLYLNTGAAIGATLEGVTDHVITGVVENTLDVSGTVAEEAPPYEVTGPVQVPGIQNIFPFCIPFDLYAFISCLYAEPEAPHFTWRFYIPNICDEEIEIDLAPFNTVAAIMRTMFLLLFCVGLAYETRKLLRS